MPSVDILKSDWNEMSARVAYTVRQDIAGNDSTVTVTGLELRSNGSYGSCFVTGSIGIDGQTVCQLILSSTVGHAVVLANGEWKAVGSVSGTPVRIAHGPDGTKAVSVSVSLKASPTSGSGSFTVGCSGAVSLDLPRIPRVSGLSASGVTLGTEMEIALTRAAEGFLDTVSWQCGDASGVIAEKTGETALSWTPPVSLAEANTQGTNVDVIFTVTTYSGETAIGSKSVTVRCQIPDSVVPALELTVTDKTGCYAKYGSFVRTRSQARVQTEASGAYGSTVKSISVSCGSLTASGEDAVFALTDPGNVTIRVTVTDSRGRTATGEETVTVADYQNPSAAITALYRCDSGGTANPQGAFGKAVFTGAVTPLNDKNAALYRLKKRIRGTESWSVSEISEYTGAYSPQGEAVFSAGVDGDWEVCVCAADDFTEITGPVTVLPVAFSLLDFHRGSKSVGILQRASTPGAVDLGGDTVHHGHRLRDVGAPEEPDDAVTLRALLDVVYPVGSIYLSTVEASPASFLGGVWERLKDRFLLAAGDAYAPGEAGGEAEHTLTEAEMAEHDHSVSPPGVNDAASVTAQMGSYPTQIYQDKKSNWTVTAYRTGKSGGGQPHNNMPPYLAVYVWERTA